VIRLFGAHGRNQELCTTITRPKNERFLRGQNVVARSTRKRDARECAVGLPVKISHVGAVRRAIARSSRAV
jgi:hypothetical protein